jgi:putative DNA primase/helicase
MNNGVIDSFRLVWAEEIAPDWEVPTLHIDATLNQGLLKTRIGRGRVRFLGQAEADTPHMKVTQLTGSFGQFALMDGRGKHLDKIWAWALATAREKGGRWLVIANKSVGDRIMETKELPEFMAMAHFNALRGLDTFGDVRGLVVLGRPMPAPSDVEMIRGALTGWATPKPLAGAYYPAKTTTITARDGSVFSVDAETHPDPIVEDVRTAICEAELVQAIGRGRGVNRTKETPLDVFVLGNVPLPGLMPDAVGRWEPLGPDGEFFAKEGIQLDNIRDMSRLMGEPDHKRIEKARSRRQTPTFPIKNQSYRDLSASDGQGARVGFYTVKQPRRDAGAFNSARITKDAGPLMVRLRKDLPAGAELAACHDPWAPGWGVVRCQVTGALNFGLAPTQQRPQP